MDFSKDGTYEVEVKGMFEVHGVKEEKSFKGSMTKSGNKISFSASFMMHVKDYKIKVPTMYVKNIAEDVKVDLKFELKKS